MHVHRAGNQQQQQQQKSTQEEFPGLKLKPHVDDEDANTWEKPRYKD